MADIQDFYNAPDDATAQERAAAMSAALRRQQAAGMLMQLSGMRTIGSLGHGIQNQAESQQAALAQAPQQRLRQTLEKQQIAQQQAQADALADPATASVLRQSLKKYGFDVDENTPAATMQNMLPTAEKTYKVDEDNARHREVAETRRAGLAEAAAARKQAHDDAVAAKADKDTDKQFVQFGQELDPTKARGGEMAKVLARHVQANAALKLVEGNPNPNAQQMYELARSFDRLVSGGAATDSATAHLVPQTALGSAADFAQWLTNSPVGRNSQAFVKQMVDSINREKSFAEDQVREWQGKKAARFSPLHDKDPARFEAELQNWGLEPSQFDAKTWRYLGSQKSAPQAAVAPHPQDSAAVQWARANPADPRAAKILQLAGAQ